MLTGKIKQTIEFSISADEFFGLAEKFKQFDTYGSDCIVPKVDTDGNSGKYDFYFKRGIKND